MCIFMSNLLQTRPKFKKKKNFTQPKLLSRKKKKLRTYTFNSPVQKNKKKIKKKILLK